MKCVLLGILGTVALTVSARTLVVDAKGGAEFTTVQAAADIATNGDVVLVKPGVYREEVRVSNRGIGPEGRVVFRSEKRGQAVIKGSEVWRRPWSPLAGSPGVFASPIDTSYFKDGKNPYLTTMSIGAKDVSTAARPLTNAVVTAETWAPRTLGQMFVDGEILTEVASLASLRRSAGTWMVSHDGASVWLHPARRQLPLADREIEWSVRARVFHAKRRSLGGVVVDGFTFEHAANQGPFPQIGLVDARTGYWTIENCTIRHAKTVGLSIGAETWDGKQIPDVPEADQRLLTGNVCVVRDNTISDCGLCGITGWSSGASWILNNVVERCNRDDRRWPMHYWGESAGIKFHGFHGVIAGNVIRDNEAHGIWLDTGFDNARISGNVIVNNRMGGIMLESAFGHVLIDNNLIGYSRAGDDFYAGDGIYSHNGSCATVAHNLLFQNAGAGVRFRTIWGKIGKRDYETSENRYYNNVFFLNKGGDLMIACTNGLSKACESDHNVYMASGYPGGTVSYPFRFANYNIGEETWTNLHARVAAAAGTNAIPFAAWRHFAQPATLDQWRAVQGMDAHSLALRGGTLEMVSRDLFLSMKLDAKICDMRVPARPGIARDFFGNPYPRSGEPVLPGPFQDPSLVTTNGAQFAVRPYEWTGLPRRRDWVRDDAPESKAFRDGETVVFLGDSITHQARWTTYLTRYYLENFPTNRYRFFNAGVGGDTAQGCLCRLAEDVTRVNPDVIVVMFGMNDLGWGIWNPTFGAKENERAETMLRLYGENLKVLAKRLKTDNPEARIVWCTPSIYDDTSTLATARPCNHNRNKIVLARGAETVRRLAAARGEQLIDFHAPMTAYNLWRQTADPAYTLVGADRVHPGAEGAFFMACEFIRQQGLDPHAPDFTKPWPETALSRKLAARNALEGELRALAAVRWYLRRQKAITDIDDMEQVKAFAAKLSAEKKRGYFEDRVPDYIRNWHWPKKREINLERIRLMDVDINKMRRE